jgi:hypothetical protein
MKYVFRGLWGKNMIVLQDARWWRQRKTKDQRCREPPGKGYQAIEGNKSQNQISEM